jgi:hypothetical protein
MFATLNRVEPPMLVKINPRHVQYIEPLKAARYDDDDAEAQGSHRAVVGTRIHLAFGGGIIAVNETLTQVERALDGRGA